MYVPLASFVAERNGRPVGPGVKAPFNAVRGYMKTKSLLTSKAWLWMYRNFDILCDFVMKLSGQRSNDKTHVLITCYSFPLEALGYLGWEIHSLCSWCRHVDVSNSLFCVKVTARWAHSIAGMYIHTWPSVSAGQAMIFSKF